ncbi:MAG: hypothetical protein ABI557_07965 [Aureliella sp.]
MLMRIWICLALVCLSKTSLAQLPDSLSHADGLSHAMLERTRFNDFLELLILTPRTRLRLSDEELSKVKDTVKARRKSYEEVLAKLNPAWKDASPSEREGLSQELVAQDQIFVEQQLEALNEALSPTTLNAIFKSFLHLDNPKMLFDPVVVTHLGLTPAEVRNMRARLDEAREYALYESLQKRDTVDLQTGSISRAEPVDTNREYQLRRESAWAELPASKLVKCFRITGMIGENDELADVMVYWTDRAEYLYAAVPAIALSWDLRKKNESSEQVAAANN